MQTDRNSPAPMPRDVRERQGSFFTPRLWVELSQQYLADYLGADWQDEYYIWDCAAGTGNLLAGLTNRHKVWASTLDQADVDLMHQRIAEGAKLLEGHVFQFDFLNDDFSKLPEGLRRIVEDPEARKRLVMYINPPYVEGDARLGHGRSGVHTSMIHQRYHKEMGEAARELFAQFLIRIYVEIPKCTIGDFSKLKNLQAPKFQEFRKTYRAKLEKIFLVPADTFDHVAGRFPISFSIWNTREEETFRGIVARVYDRNGEYLGEKTVASYDGRRLLAEWLSAEGNGGRIAEPKGRMASVGSDFQNQSTIFIENPERRRKRGGRHTLIGRENLIVLAVFFAVRHCIPASWLNDRDQFLWPDDGWLADPEFQSDCLAYTLLHGQNRISSAEGTNHWIPFPEESVNARERYASRFMLDFIAGKLPVAARQTESDTTVYPSGQTPVSWSEEAQALMGAGLALWRYYHAQPDAETNASYYDIRRHFQGVNPRGRMNTRSEDGEYTLLAGDIRARRLALGEKIAARVYRYGFLMG
ncbi:MAG: hypothetical protein CSA07_01310 [Bacteroidia bacterium]|nr:MAG: hypothetical protein CSA07_01310 [Bacteroidia bacterium]